MSISLLNEPDHGVPLRPSPSGFQEEDPNIVDRPGKRARPDPLSNNSPAAPVDVLDPAGPADPDPPNFDPPLEIANNVTADLLSKKLMPQVETALRNRIQANRKIPKARATAARLRQKREDGEIPPSLQLIRMPLPDRAKDSEALTKEVETIMKEAELKLLDVLIKSHDFRAESLTNDVDVARDKLLLELTEQVDAMKVHPAAKTATLSRLLLTYDSAITTADCTDKLSKLAADKAAAAKAAAAESEDAEMEELLSSNQSKLISQIVKEGMTREFSNFKSSIFAELRNELKHSNSKAAHTTAKGGRPNQRGNRDRRKQPQPRPQPNKRGQPNNRGQRRKNGDKPSANAAADSTGNGRRPPRAPPKNQPPSHRPKKTTTKKKGKGRGRPSSTRNASANRNR